MEFILRRRLRRRMKDMVWTPWSEEIKRKATAFTKRRRQLGAHGDWFTQLPWFDDNSRGVLCFFTSTLKEMQYAMWDEFNVEWAPKKSATMLYGCSKWEPIIGWELRVKERRRLLPPSKAKGYTELIEATLKEADKHKRKLVQADPFDSLLGKLAHAVLGIPTLWGEFITLVQSKMIQRREHRAYLRMTETMSKALRSAKEKLEKLLGSELASTEGLPFTSYELRPGVDNYPIWISFTDASRRTSTFFGAAGGWFRLRASSTVFFFMHKWPEEQVEQH